MHNTLVVIVGPTAAGKSALAVRLAKTCKGEIVSADSRQVYKGLDIGSGKITKKEMQDIPHHLLGVASPQRRFTVSQYRLRVMKAISSILRHRKLPIIVGGSPFYVYSVVDSWNIPAVKPNWKLRRKLETFSTKQLFQKLQKVDRARSKTIEKKNRRRLIRALEIIFTTKKPVPPIRKESIPVPWDRNDVLFIGIKKTPQQLKERIATRLQKRFAQGMIKEVSKLHMKGVSWKRLEELGLEYRYIALYLQEKLPLNDMKQKLQRAIEHFARHQMTWFKKDKRIHWITKAHEAFSLLSPGLRHPL